MTTIPTDLLARLRAVLTTTEAMTPGTWSTHEDVPRAIVADADPHMSLLGLDVDGCAIVYKPADAAGLVALRNATADLAALLALVEAPAPHVDRDDLALAMVAAGDNSGHADAIRSGRTPLPGWALAAASVAIARLTGQAPAPLTVGAALADPRVQDGSHVVGVRGLVDPGPNFYMQFRVDRYVQSRMLLGQGAWMTWGVHSIVNGADLALPCRLVPLAVADRDPNERGPL